MSIATGTSTKRGRLKKESQRVPINKSLLTQRRLARRQDRPTIKRNNFLMPVLTPAVIIPMSAGMLHHFALFKTDGGNVTMFPINVHKVGKPSTMPGVIHRTWLHGVATSPSRR